MTLEKDVDIPMRDGAKLKADVFRPEGDGHFPVLINMGIYQKDKLWVPPHDLEEKPNPYMNWETVNPEWWVPRGYCCVRVDERGSGKSPGQSVLYSPQEAIDFYDAIEWAGHQPWSNGRVATIGISFFARTQWWVANLKPPSLTCIVPWEGAADQYRDILYHGGIFGSGFIVGWFTTHMAHHMLGRAYENNPDTFQDNVLWRFMRNSLDSGMFKSQQAQWDKIDLPMWAVGNWSGMGLHLRGATEGYMRAASKNKKLRIHCGTHLPSVLQRGRPARPAPLLRLLAQGHRQRRDAGAAGEARDPHRPWRIPFPPRERMADRAHAVDQIPSRSVRAGRRRGNGHCRHARQSQAGRRPRAAPIPPAAPAMAAISRDPRATPAFRSSRRRSTQDTEITGPLMAKLWVSSTTEDMDLLLTLRNIDPAGNDVLEVGQQGQPVPVAKGWLRVSHRELDPDLSLPYRPYHKHLRRLWLKPNEIVEVQVEIWPTSMVFKQGHRIRLDIQPRDGIGSAPYTHYHADYNVGDNTIYSGGDKESYLLVPIIPPK